MPLPDDICAVIVTYNTGDAFRGNFATLKGGVAHALIVDNGSAPDTRAMLDEIIAQNPGFAERIENPENGLARAYNIGIAAARAKGFNWVMLLDDDSALTPGMARTMLDAYNSARRADDIGMIVPTAYDTGAKSLLPHYRLWHGVFVYRSGFQGHATLDDVISAYGSGSLIPLKTIERAGLFDEGYFIDYIDNEFCLRLRARGLRILAVRDAVLNHSIGNIETHRLMGMRLRTTNHSPMRRYYSFRNRLLTWKRYALRFPGFVLFDALRTAYELARIGLLERDRIAKLKAIGQGLRDGLRGKSGAKPS